MKFIVSSKIMQSAITWALEDRSRESFTIDLIYSIMGINGTTIFGDGKDAGTFTAYRGQLIRLNEVLKNISDQPITLVLDSKITIQSITI